MNTLIIMIAATTGIFTFISAHSHHKRVVIKVPQRTRHIYHHHVKKIPVYVLLPEKKPRILDDFDDIPKGSSCKHQSSYLDDKISPYRYARHYTDLQEHEGKEFSNKWKEDKENKGAYISDEGYNTVDYNLVPPPFEKSIPFRRANSEYLKENSKKNFKQSKFYDSYFPIKQSVQEDEGDKSVPDPIYITYPPSHSSPVLQNFENSRQTKQAYASSFQYQIQHKNDVI